MAWTSIVSGRYREFRSQTIALARSLGPAEAGHRIIQDVIAVMVSTGEMHTRRYLGLSAAVTGSSGLSGSGWSTQTVE